MESFGDRSQMTPLFHAWEKPGNHSMTYTAAYAARSVIWMVIYLLFIFLPLFALLTGSLPPARDFWTEFSAALGYSGLAIMGLQFGLTARFRFVTEPWGRMSSIISIGGFRCSLSRGWSCTP